MKEVVFALQFQGTAEPVPGATGQLRARTLARNQVLRTTVGPKGIQGKVELGRNAAALFESEVEMIGKGTFRESGHVTYGPAGRVTFRTVGQGVLGPSGQEGVQRGAVIWEVTGGEGRLAGASGLITSNFTVGPQGQVTDNQYARLFLSG